MCMSALSTGRRLAYVFGAGSDLSELRTSGVSEIKRVDKKNAPRAIKKDKINSYVLILQSTALQSRSPSRVLRWT